MDKKGLIGVVQGIIVLVVIGVTVTFFVNMASEGSRRFIGVTNVTQLDTESVEAYEAAEEMAKVPADSMKALTFAINALAYSAYWDKWQSIGRTAGEFLERGEEEIYEENRRSFGQSKVSTIPYGLKRLRLGTGGFYHARAGVKYTDKSEEDVYLRLTMAILDCWLRFRDSAYDNVYCFDTSYSAAEGWESINEDNFKNWYDDHNDYYEEGDATEAKLVSRTIASYYNLGDNKSGVDEYISILDSVFGEDTFWGLIASDLTFATEDENIVDSERYVICGTHSLEVDREIWVLPIHEWERCDVDEKETLANKKYSYFVKDFELPQSKDDIFDEEGDQKPYLESNADPAYVIYYEAFPEGEDQIWKIKPTEEALQAAVFAAGFSAAIDVVTFGLGSKVIKPILKFKPVGKVINPILDAPKKAISRTLNAALTGFRSAVRSVLRIASSKGPGRMGQEMVSASVEAVIRGSSRWAARLGAKLGTVGEADAAKRLAKEIAGEMSEEYFEKTTGRLTKEGADAIRESLAKKFDDVLQYTDIGDILTKSDFMSFVDDVIRGGKIRFNEQFMKEAIEMHNQKQILKGILEGSPEEAAEVLGKELGFAEKKILANMDQKQMAKVISKSKAKLNTHLWNDVEGKLAFDAGLEGVSRAEAEALNGAFDRAITRSLERNEMGFVGRHMRDLLVGLGKFPIKNRNRYLAAFYLGLWWWDNYNAQEKFVNVGTNAIGLRSPFEYTVTYDQTKMPLEYTDITNQNKEDFFRFYGSENYIGLLPEVGAYYLQLERDKLPWWPDQDPQRFFLVSPCRSDVYLHVDQCECFDSDDPEEGLYEYRKSYSNVEIEDEEGNVEYISVPARPLPGDGRTMLYTLKDDEELRWCAASSWFGETLLGPDYKPDCIRINPLIQEGYNEGYNFCYGGTHQLAEFLKGAVTVVEIGAIVGAAVFTPLSFGSTALIGAGAAFAGELLRHFITEEMEKWPDHGTGT